MPTNNKTTNFSLNNWLGTDKPKREDFAGDNVIIDTALGNHIADSNAHVTAALLGLINAPFVMGTVTGDGTAMQNVSLDFSPKCVFVFKNYSPFWENDTTNNCIKWNCGIVFAQGDGRSIGLGLTNSTLKLLQSQTVPEDGNFHNMNVSGHVYKYIAFK